MAATKKNVTVNKEEPKSAVKATVKTPVKAEAPKAEAPKAEAAKTEAPKAEAVKAEAPKSEEVKAEVKPTAEKKPAAKTAAKKPAAKKASEKKPAEKRPVGRPAGSKAASKKEVKSEITLQFSGKSFSQEELIKIAKDVWQYDLQQKAEDLTSVELYVKPEENVAYYVMNKEFTGSFYL